MENKLHMQDESLANVLDNYTVRCIDSDMDTKETTVTNQRHSGCDPRSRFPRNGA
jgi:hypothetical protein